MKVYILYLDEYYTGDGLRTSTIGIYASNERAEQAKEDYLKKHVTTVANGDLFIDEETVIE